MVQTILSKHLYNFYYSANLSILYQAYLMLPCSFLNHMVSCHCTTEYIFSCVGQPGRAKQISSMASGLGLTV